MRLSVAFQLPSWYLPPPEPQVNESTAYFVSLDGSQPDTLIAAGCHFFAVHFSKIAGLVQNLSQHPPNPRGPHGPISHRFRSVAKRDPANALSRHLGIVDTDVADAKPTGLYSPTQHEVRCFEIWLRAAYRLVVPFRSLEDLRDLYDLASQFCCHSWMGPYLDWLLPNIVDSEFWFGMRNPDLRVSHVRIAEDTKSRLLYHDALTILSVELDDHDPHKEAHLSVYLDGRTISLAKAVSERRRWCVTTAKSQLTKICQAFSLWIENQRSGSHYKVAIAVQELSALRDMPINSWSPTTPKPVTEIMFLSKIVDVLNRLKAHRLGFLEEEPTVMDKVNDLRKFAKRKQLNGMKLDRCGKFEIITSEVWEEDIDLIFGPQIQNQYVAH